jgi:2'-5' RNA ligase
LFTAIALPDSARGHLISVLSDLSTYSDLKEVKWTRPENLHVTLKFLGEVREEMVSSVREALRGVEMISATLYVDHITGFPRHTRAHVIACALAGGCEKVSFVFGQIEKACEPLGIPRDRRGYTPHVTIGRSRNAVNLARHEGHARLRGPTFVASSFELVKSQLTTSGPIYERIEAYNAR